MTLAQTHDQQPLRLFNSLTRELEPFVPVRPGEARVYTCGPTVYNYQHIGNMRAYVFADTLGRALSWAGYALKHVINITDVGHLTSDADAGDDKMEQAAALQGKSAWDIARHYQDVFEADLARLNVRPVTHPRATDYVDAMIEWVGSFDPAHIYELDSGLYFDTASISDYGKLARAVTGEGESRIGAVDGKRNAADFALWRKTPVGETRQMEWDSPWGKGAPGWHLECSVMSERLLGFPFDIHTGGIDHREIHHANEIAQNQAFCGCDSLDTATHSGARMWLHNNFLVDRRSSGELGKMSKSSGEFLTLQALVDRGYHPLAYRMMCLQAHYRSELEFSWEGLQAALVRLKRIVMAIGPLRDAVAGDPAHAKFAAMQDKFAAAIGDDLNTPTALVALEEALAVRKVDAGVKRAVIEAMDRVLGLDLFALRREDLRIRPKGASVTAEQVEAAIALRKELRAQQDYPALDRNRGELAAQGVEVMDGDPLGWDWRL